MKLTDSKGLKGALYKTGFYIMVFLIAAVFFSPILWMFFTSTQPYRNLKDLTFSLKDSNFSAYASLVTNAAFLRSLRASFIISLGSSLLSMIVAILAAYAGTFYRFKGRDVMIMSTLTIQMAPAVLLMIPIFIMCSKTGLTGTYPGLILVLTLFVGPMICWMLRTYFKDVPRELFDSALIDGCSRTSIIYRIILPLVRPGLVACFIYAFICAWNEVLITIILCNSQTTTLTLYAATYTTSYEVDYASLASLGIFASLPSIIMVVIFNKQLIQGLMEGAVKG